MFPDKSSVHTFFAHSLLGQMHRELNSVFLKVVDTDTNDDMVDFIKWASPDMSEGYRAD